MPICRRGSSAWPGQTALSRPSITIAENTKTCRGSPYGPRQTGARDKRTILSIDTGEIPLD